MTLLENTSRPRSTQRRAPAQRRARKPAAKITRSFTESPLERAPRLPGPGGDSALGLAVAKAQRLFDALPELSARHTAADLADKSADGTGAEWLEIDRAYQRHLAALSRANLSILGAPVESIDGLHQKLQSFILATAAVVVRPQEWETLDLEAALEKLQAVDWTDEFAPALTAVARDLSRLAAASPRSQGSTRRRSPTDERWTTALATYELARAEHQLASDQMRRRHAQDFAACPRILKEPQLHWGFHCRWSSASEIASDPLLSDAERPAITAALGAWRKVTEGLEAARSDDDGDLDELDDREADAFEALMATAAPDLDALLRKQAISFREASEDGFGLEDLGYVAHCLQDELPLRMAIDTHRDTLRLAGRDHAVLDMEPFSARRWIAHFQAAGGRVSHADQALLLIYPQWESTARRREAADLVSGLDATPWKYRAVALTAHMIRNGGGDPLFDAHGNHGTADLRGGRQSLATPPARLDRIVFRRAGGRPEPVIRRYRREAGRLAELPAAASELARDRL